jgi:phage/plasmid-like protein (TIGR03299 family)
MAKASSFFRVGSNVSSSLTSSDAIAQAGLDWSVSAQPIYTGIRTADGDMDYREIVGQRGVVRSDTNDTIGVVGEKYTVIQNHEAFDFFDSIVAGGKAQYASAGSFSEGRRIFLTADMGEIEIHNPNLVGDTVQKYLVLTNTHDGSGALQAFFSNVRIVCENTLNMAIRMAKDGIKIKHTRNAKDRMLEAQRVMQAADRYQDDFMLVANTLAGQSFTLDQMKEYANALMPMKVDAKVSTRSDNNREELISLFENGKGNSGKTLWDAYNAATEWSDHHRGTRLVNGRDESEARLASNWFGAGFAFKQEAFAQASKIAGLKF